MKRERVRSKHGFKGFGSFILGWFIGFICTILIIAGVGYWAYTSLDVKKIEKWTKSNITSNKDVENMTLQDAVAIVKGISKGSDEYTLAKFEEDFGLKLLGDSMYGVSLDKVKNSPIKELDKAFTDTVESATFANVLSFMEVEGDLGLLDSILDGEITYYVQDNKLYTSDTFDTEVDFSYEISNSEVKVGSGKHTIKTGGGYSIITPTLEHLPLKTAMSEIENATKGMKICDIMDYRYNAADGKYYKTYSNGEYSDPVSGVMNAIADYAIDDLSNQSKIDELEIHEVMGYYYNQADKNYYTTSNFQAGTKVAGAMNALAGKELGDLSKESTFNGLYIYQVMGYYEKIEGSNKTYYQNYNASTQQYSNKVTGIMSTIAGKTVGELDDDGAFNDVLLIDALGYTVNGGKVYESDGTTEVTGVVKHLVLDGYGTNDATTISTIASKVKDLTIGQVLDVPANAPSNSTIINALHDKTIDNLDNEIKKLTLGEILGGKSDSQTPVVKALWGKNIEQLKGAIDDLTLGTALGVEKSGATGAIKVLYETKITELNSAMGNLRVCEAMGYYYDEVNNKYYKQYDGTTYSEEVTFTGIMKAIANTKVDELTNTIDTLKAVDVLDAENTPVLNLFSSNELNVDYDTTDDKQQALTIMELPNAVVDRLNSDETTIGDLITAKVIVVKAGTQVSDHVKGLTISKLIDELSEIK